MRALQRAAAAFISLLLLTHAGVAFAAGKSHGCMFDELMRESGPLPQVLVPELPVRGHGASRSYAVTAEDQWKPLRILVSDLDLQKPEKHCTNDTNGKNISDMRGGNVLCSADSILTPETRLVLTAEVLPKAIQLHTDRLMVKESQNPWKVPPFSEGVCSHFTVPATHHNPGVSAANMVLYVSSVPIKSTGSFAPLAWAVPCAQGGRRPVAVAMNFHPSRIVAGRHAVRRAAHEIAHALGFGYDTLNTLSMVTTTEVRGKKGVAVVKSEKTKEKARLHYGCASAEGMELEDGEGGKPQSHWERRNAKDELMAPFFSGFDVSILGLYTSLTLAAFEDTGYYKARYEMAEPMEWGNNAGCDFLNADCVKKGVTPFPKMFCTETTAGEQLCPSDRLGSGRCFLQMEGKSIPEQFRYFSSDSRGGYPYLLTDHCPIVQQESGLLCSSTGSMASMMAGSILGNSSWCLDGEDLVTRGKGRNETVGGVCAKVRCEGGAVKVRYLGSDIYHNCPAGTSITPSSRSFVKGKIKCPKFAEVCTVLHDGSSSLSSKPVAFPPLTEQEKKSISRARLEGTAAVTLMAAVVSATVTAVFAMAI